MGTDDNLPHFQPAVVALPPSIRCLFCPREKVTWVLEMFWFWGFSFLFVSLALAAPGEDRPIWGGGGAKQTKETNLDIRTTGQQDTEDPLGLRRGLVNGNNPLGDDGNDRNGGDRCSDYENFGYYCVDFFLCRSEANFTINTSGAGLFEVRRVGGETNRIPEREKVLETACDESTKVCCQTPSGFIDSQDPPQDVDVEPSERRPGLAEFTQKHSCDLPSGIKLCGNRNRGSVSNDLEVPAIGQSEFGEWPHVCALLRSEPDDGGEPVKIYECGASILNEGVVLTAAHCVNGIEAEHLMVRCGEWNTHHENEPLKHQERKVETVVKHPEFRSSEHYFNFALLFLEEEFIRAKHIAPICLPSPCTNFKAGDLCVAGGYGKDAFGDEGRYATIQKEVVVPLVDSNTCQQRLRETRLGKFFELHSSFLCAGGKGQVDTCQGDGGSPLTCKIAGTNSWLQAGIVSWGIGCGSDSPAVYAKVAKASCWIDYEVSAYYEREGSYFGFDEECDKDGYETGFCPDDI